MNCRRVKRVALLYAADPAGMRAELAAAFRTHLEICPGCLAEIEAARLLLSSLRRACQRRAAPEHLRLRILSVIRVTRD